MRGRRFRGLVAVVLPVVLLAALAGVAAAAVKITDVPKSWDDAANQYENGNLTMWLNNDLQPFWAEIGFDNALYPVPACGTTNETMYAGDALIGLYHLDTNGAPGFQATQDWALVDCATFATNRYPDPAAILATCVPEDLNTNNPCEVTSRDVVTACTTGNCTEEIVTTFKLSMDLDCDGTIDPPFAPAGGLCMYWAATKPPSTLPVWSGNLQVRINDGGGDKTLNSNELRGPNAVTVQSFTGAPAAVNPLAVVLGVLLFGLPGLALAWRSARG
jgi:hypothetical protein